MVKVNEMTEKVGVLAARPQAFEKPLHGVPPKSFSRPNHPQCRQYQISQPQGLRLSLLP